MTASDLLDRFLLELVKNKESRDHILGLILFWAKFFQGDFSTALELESLIIAHVERFRVGEDDAKKMTAEVLASYEADLFQTETKDAPCFVMAATQKALNTFSEFEEPPEHSVWNEFFERGVVPQHQEISKSMDMDGLSSNPKAKAAKFLVRIGMLPAPDSHTLLGFSSYTIAQHMAVRAQRALAQLPIDEFFDKAWRGEKSTALRQIATNFNNLTRWVEAEITSCRTKHVRRLLIEKFIRIAHRSRCIGNFDGVVVIVTSLRSSKFERLLKVCAAEETAQFRELEKLLHPAGVLQAMRIAQDTWLANAAAARESNKPPQPGMPFVGMFVGDAARAADQDTYVKQGQLNLFKLKAQARFVQALLGFVALPGYKLPLQAASESQRALCCALSFYEQ